MFERLFARRLLLFQIGVLLVLYATGTFVRMAPVANWGVYVTADDPVLHVRVTEYVLENGHLPRNDTLAWYPWGQSWEKTLPNFRYYLTAGIYSFARGLGLKMPLYDFCVFFPAFFAPLAVFPMFLLVRKLKDWKAALIASGVLVLCSGYLTRTIAGFYRHEHVGIPLLILCMYLFLKAVKAEDLRSSLVYSLLSGAGLVILTGTLSAFRFLLDGYAVFILLAILTGRVNVRLATAFAITDGMALASTFLWPNLVYTSFYRTTEFALAFTVLVVVLVYYSVLKYYLDPDKLAIGTLAVAFVVLVFMYGTVSYLPTGRYESILNPGREAVPGDVSQTVAEHASMKLEFSGGRLNWPALSSYGLFLFLAPLGMILPFVRPKLEDDSTRNILLLVIFSTFILFLALDTSVSLMAYAVLWLSLIALWYLTPEESRPGNEIMMMIIFTLFATYFFKNMIRLNIVFSVFVAIQSGLFFGFGLDMLAGASRGSKRKVDAESRSRKRRDRRRRKKRREEVPEPAAPAPRPFAMGPLAVALVFVLLLGWTTSTSYRSAKAYPLGLREDWFGALSWLQENSEPDDVIMSWWDYGYWIQTYANRRTIADGATTNSSQIRRLAKAFITTEAEAIRFCSEFDVRFIVVDVTDDFIGGKWTAMAFIAGQNVNEYMGSEDGQTVLYDKGQKAPLFRLASRLALTQPLPLDDHFQYRADFVGNLGGRVIIYEFV